MEDLVLITIYNSLLSNFGAFFFVLSSVVFGSTPLLDEG